MVSLHIPSISFFLTCLFYGIVMHIYCENIISLRRNTLSQLCARTDIALTLQKFSFLKTAIYEIKVIAPSQQAMYQQI